jgi:hypothetical protein
MSNFLDAIRAPALTPHILNIVSMWGVWRIVGSHTQKGAEKKPKNKLKTHARV